MLNVDRRTEIGIHPPHTTLHGESAHSFFNNYLVLTRLRNRKRVLPTWDITLRPNSRLTGIAGRIGRKPGVCHGENTKIGRENDQKVLWEKPSPQVLV
ncbi:hypothetical protein C1H46_045087 [Malus baccata]|uniref:Uncharacterized protein n=1 Tax=Malus baccata TaxID=106549 RepID=A0A540K566_MALBA|nr:hypothetical protein C1H46_045087 [Malus baccata]